MADSKFDWNKFPSAPDSSKGGKFDWNQFPADSAKPSESESALRGAISGVTANLDDEIVGGVGAAGRVLGVKNLGSFKPFDPDSHLEFAAPTLSPDEIVQAYRENRDATRAEQKLDMETNPKATIAGNLAGSIISPAGKLGAGAKGGKLVRAMKAGAQQGAAFAAGASDSDLTKGEIGQFAKDTAEGAALGAVVPPALEAAGYGIKKGAQAAGWTGKKLFTGAFGVTEENVSKYLANPERINAAKSIGEIKDLVDESVGKLRDAVEQGKITEDQAKSALQANKEQITRGLADKKVDAKDALRATESLFQGAKERALAPLKEVQAPTHLASDVSEMVGDLKSKIRQGSGEALRTLESSGEKVDLNGVYSKIDDTIDRLKEHGTEEAKSIINKLHNYKADLMSENWANIPAAKAKKLIQGLDAITEYSPMAGAFDQAKNAAFKGVRHELDEAVKTSVPEYRTQMAELAPKAQLLDAANSAFGKPELAVSRLGRLNTPRGEFDRATLKRLEEAVGKAGAVTRDADKFAAAQKVLKDPQAIRKIEQGLPEYQSYRQAMADVAKRNPKWTRQQIEQATAKERRALAEAVSRRVFAEKAFEPFRSLAPGSTENKIKSIMKGGSSNIENQKVLEGLGKKTGQDYLQMADDLGVKQAFEKPFHHGARNTVLWTVLGGVFGGVPGGAVGATYGGLVDRYGPKMAKSILDGVVKIKNNPTVQTVRGLNLPENIKSELEREFRVYVIMKNASEGQMSRVAGSDEQPSRTPSGGPERWARNGLEKLGIEDNSIAEKLMSSKEGKQLLIEASDLTPGSKRFEKIKDQIQKGWGQK